MTYLEENLDRKLSEILIQIQSRIKYQTTYFGIKTLKNPLDNWIIQEIIFEQKPDVIIEIGNLYGGSTLNIAHFCDLMKHGRVIGIDISHLKVPPFVREHSRITLIEGEACESISQVEKMIEENERVMIIEDSSHTYVNTLNILRIYSKLIKVGDYFIVEDGICYHGLDEGPYPGPYEAIEEFLLENSSFICDREKESFLITWNPKGFLVRIADDNRNSSNDQQFVIKKTGIIFQSIFRNIQLFVPPIIPILVNKLKRKISNPNK